MNNDLQKIKSGLPYKYGKIISARLNGNVSAEQVRLVFSGEITDPAIIRSVLQEAKTLLVESEEIKTMSQQIAGMVS